jgi:hypothetical protein
MRLSRYLVDRLLRRPRVGIPATDESLGHGSAAAARGFGSVRLQG